MLKLFIALYAAFNSLSAQSGVLIVNPENAASQVAKVRAGDTLSFKPGVYRFTLDLRNILSDAGNPTVIRGAPGLEGRTVFRGSDLLCEWRLLEAGWYSHFLAKEPSQVFINGRILRQIGGTVFDGYPSNPSSEYRQLHSSDGGIWPGRIAPTLPKNLPAESFWYDSSKSTLHVKTSENLISPSVVAEASQRERVLFLENVRHLNVIDIDIEHANTSVTNRGGALVVWKSDDVRLSGIHAKWNDLIGIQLAGNRISLVDSESSYNGQMGVSGSGDGMTVSRVRSSYNNRRGFNKWWEAGGFKFIGFDAGGIRNSRVEDSQALHNAGDGIWFDWKNNQVEISRNLSAYNSGFGIHYEASSNGVIQDNLVIGNGQRGIHLSSSHDSIVKNNLLLGNGGEGVVSVTERGRVDNQNRPFRSDGNIIEHNVIAWNSEGMVYLSTESGNVSDMNALIGEGAPSRFSKDYPSVVNPPSYGLQAWSKRTGQDQHSWWANRPMPIVWRNYLSTKSTLIAPLTALLRDVRLRPEGIDVVYGNKVPASGSEAPTPFVGPRQLLP